MTKHQIGTIDEFPEGKATPVSVDGIQLAIFNVDGELYAIVDNCLHKNLPLSKIGDDAVSDESLCSKKARFTLGEIDETNLTVSCPYHYMEWSLETGKSPVFDYRLPTYNVTIDEDDVFVTL
ncbi:Rieske (2Fe-2S) protein [Natronomonas marina]|jgi:nitrite reductase (NADH) small subunit|uniref:Rieske (2Fe-2S) protein n=1 Tax=Natronomonas marina TaxID=2961939 RepID=UPI0020C99C06|nr:Rieske 2Fe-2S domain-containing protein [Natronomonas marina]